MRTRWKVLITIWLAVGYWLVMQHVQRDAHKSPTTETIYQVRDYDMDMVEVWFRIFNEKYFQNRLPRTTMFLWADSHQAKFEDRYLGNTTCNASITVCTIVLDSYYNKANVTAQLTLLHEMCHAETTGVNLDPHGPAWRGCMVRIYKANAMEGLL